MEITLKAKSSGGEPYNVIFSLEGEALFVKCNCQAGSFHTLCKHRVQLLCGDKKMLADTQQEGELAQVVEWGKKAGYPAALERLLRVEAEIEKQVQKLKKEVTKVKKEIEECMTLGLRPPQ